MLSRLKPNYSNSLYYGEFGIIWGIRKPHRLASTRGSETCLLDLLVNYYDDHPLIQQAIDEFGTDGELGMLTRLDNDTAGMIWFARTHESKSLWLQAQSKHQISKIYEADAIGRVKKEIIINVPLMHHRYDDTKMITINTDADTEKGRGTIHQVSTHIIPGEISGSNTHIQATIHQGCRHQIRAHCAHHGNPILGESIYHKQKTDTVLHLRSVGLQRDQLSCTIIINYQQYKDQIYDQKCHLNSATE